MNNVIVIVWTNVAFNSN